MIALVDVVVRNLVPIVGIVFFDWSAANVLLLYFVDTPFAIGVMAAGLLYHIFPEEEAEGFAARLNAIFGYIGGAAMVAALRKYTPDQLGLKRRFALVFLRWVAMLFVAFTPVTYALGHFGAFVLVVAYIAISIYAELRPDRFLAAFADGESAPKKRT